MTTAILSKNLSFSDKKCNRFVTRKNVPQALKWGMLLIGIGLGILIGRILALYTAMGEEESFFSMVFLCGGISLVLYHFIAKNYGKEGPSHGLREANRNFLAYNEFPWLMN